MSCVEPQIDFLSLRMGRVNHPDLDFLWIGSKNDAANKDALISNNISCIVNCTRDHLEGGVKNYHEGERGFRYIRIPLRDVESEIIQLSSLRDAWRFMKKAKDAGVNCLVHCAMGKSRSSAVLLSFIMHKTGKTYEEALALVKEARAVAEPNPAFADQLRFFYLSGDLKSDF